MANSMDRRTLVALVNASGAINRELDIQEVFKRIAEWASTVLDTEGASVLILDQGKGEMVFRAATGPGAPSLENVRFDAKLGICGQVTRTGRAVIVNDARENRHFFAGIDAITQIRTSALMAAPLIHHEEVLGVVEVINPRTRETFNESDLELLEVFANLAAAAAANAREYDRVNRHNRVLREAQKSVPIIGRSQPITEAIKLIEKVAVANATVLLHGETGTGKELAARAIHDFSPRSDHPFIAINCAALPESLLESELFGHERGAFTGAAGQKLGRFELANGGTLFLDEIGEISQAIQAKLLRVLQEREFIRVGGTSTINCDVRIVAATNRDLKAEMEANRFRADLYYRLNVFPIQLPPLRERVEDIPDLVEFFIEEFARPSGHQPPRISDETLALLMRYEWPGNIRELRNIIERCVLLASDGEIRPESLPVELGVAISGSQEKSSNSGSSKSKLADHERALILKALNDFKWNQSAAARALGVSRDHLRYRIKKYDLRAPSRRHHTS